uniref:Capsid protein n=1 Tax=Okra enation leaf curl virus TaxID=908125 RepID=A0A1I9RH23_9GEMI|nr:coat protein [Okra enation leaf curl virus]
MSKRPADIVISTPASKVRRRLNFDSPYSTRAVAPTVRVTKSRMWANRSMYRKPTMYRMYRSPDVPRGCEGPCKVQSSDAKNDIGPHGKGYLFYLMSPRVLGADPSNRQSFLRESLYFVGKIWMDEIIRIRNHTNTVMFWIVRDRRPTGTPYDFQQVFNVYDNEPFTATVKNDQRDRFQVLRRFQATVTGGQYACKEQVPIRKFYRVNNYVVYNHQEAGKYENHTENALLLYMACTHASNPVYATLKVRSYFYDSVTN